MSTYGALAQNAVEGAVMLGRVVVTKHSHDLKAWSKSSYAKNEQPLQSLTRRKVLRDVLETKKGLASSGSNAN